ncbi:MAG: 16S rRNA (cytosine(1402)-N(4))-methyltransferase RsmH [Haliscomenobacteraceae bacterium CHB4]|nr:Ribosomal RNA small subunit methyltransferase H [Saprospiraceae bacterium]MCE7926468.1 16S rRNA (cytosine(1402)-N(4))-methyltransferase RsmH [Haliscomenobacteraceae bacterium CHB4]
MTYHESVLLRESIEYLGIIPGGIYVDATFGGGGHSRLILEKLGGKGRLFAFDQDEDAKRNTEQPEFSANPCFTFIHANFRHLKRHLRAEAVRPGTVNGILADLGVSSFQFDTPERGFSYRFEAELDMRMNKQEGQTAADILNGYEADALQRVFSELGEVRNSKTLAQAVVRARAQKPFRTTGDLADLCNKNLMGEKMRYLSQVFQALRMEVNDELGALEDILKDAYEMLAPGGRLAVITFHSLEDRMVKHFLKTGNVAGDQQKDFYGNIERPFELITKKPIEPSEEEISRNPRARSSKLRVGEKRDSTN